MMTFIKQPLNQNKMIYTIIGVIGLTVIFIFWVSLILTLLDK
jgi:hypothetical protein